MSDDHTPPPCILSEDEFKAGVAEWQAQAMQAKSQPALLDTLFSATGKPDKASRLLYLSMPADWVRSLISTVGCSEVKNRFLIRNGQFAMCFYATDSQNKRLSAYYLLDANTTNMGNILAAMYGKPSGGEASGGDDDGGVQVPHGVAGDWISNWQKANSITYDMFATFYGLLQGYNFSRGDLSDNLFNEKQNDYQQLRVDFGLHKYYGRDDDAAAVVQPTYTFGLVLRLVNPDNTFSDTPFYDMSAPCPPTY